MRPPTITAGDTERDFAAFMTAFSEDVVHGADDPGPAIDRYYVPDFELYTDGLRLDRDKLIAHIAPVRRNGAGDFRYEVHEAMLCGSRLAARFTLHSTLTRKNRTVRTQVYLFADLAPDGRLARVDQLTRILPDDPG